MKKAVTDGSKKTGRTRPNYLDWKTALDESTQLALETNGVQGKKMELDDLMDLGVDVSMSSPLRLRRSMQRLAYVDLSQSTTHRRR